jgi:hypothetical protein
MVRGRTVADRERCKCHHIIYSHVLRTGGCVECDCKEFKVRRVDPLMLPFLWLVGVVLGAMLLSIALGQLLH